MNALVASAKMSNLLYAALLKLFGPGIAGLAKEFGLGDSVVLRDMKACLWPVWRVDGIFEGRVEGKGGKKGKGWVGVKEGYVPGEPIHVMLDPFMEIMLKITGNPFAPLSYLSFAVPPLPDDLPRYNPAKDLRQLGEGYDVVAVPFTVSPMSLVKRIRGIMGRRTSWEGIRLDETEWKEDMVGHPALLFPSHVGVNRWRWCPVRTGRGAKPRQLACYPIMFPIYIAQFEHKAEDKTRSFTVVVDAHDENASAYPHIPFATLIVGADQ
jgi:hypothetical protein